MRRKPVIWKPKNDGDWPRGKWLVVDPFRTFSLPALAGVYVVLINGEATYVGSSCNLRVRFREHAFKHGYGAEYHTPWGDVPNDVPIVVKVKLSRHLGEWAMQEIRLIWALQPICNRRDLAQRAWIEGKRRA